MTPTMQYAVQAAIVDLLATSGPLDHNDVERVFEANGLAIVDAKAIEEAEEKAFGRGVEFLLREVEADEYHRGRMRREGLEEPVLTYTREDLGSIAADTFDGD